MNDNAHQTKPLPPRIKSGMQDVFYLLDRLRGYRPPKRNAEASSIIRMLKRGYTPKQIIGVWETIKADKFWRGKELFMMTVESQIGAVLKDSGKVPSPDKYLRQKYGHMVRR
jgi:hypothetical protein